MQLFPASPALALAVRSTIATHMALELTDIKDLSAQGVVTEALAGKGFGPKSIARMQNCAVYIAAQLASGRRC